MQANRSKVGVAVTTINSELDHESITDSRSLPHDSIMLWGGIKTQSITHVLVTIKKNCLNKNKCKKNLK